MNKLVVEQTLKEAYEEICAVDQDQNVIDDVGECINNNELLDGLYISLNALCSYNSKDYLIDKVEHAIAFLENPY